jgi:M6 family metalloprotease-like protein
MVDDTNYDGAIDSWKVLRDAVEVADPDVDFANFDKLIVLHAGFGQESSGNTNDIWSVAYIGSLWVRTEDKKSFYGGAIVPEMEDRGASALGVACHELAHLIGLPDLYSTKGLRYVGRWGLMDRGLWNGDPAGSSPAHPCAWSSLHLQWTSEDKIHTATLGSKTDTIVAPSGSDAPDGQVQLVKIPLSSDGKEYHLIEVRSHIGFDAALPGEGVIIYTVNERKQPMKGRVQIYDANPSTEDLNDAYFESGMTFINSEEQLSVKVLDGQDDNSYTIQVYRS